MSLFTTEKHGGEREIECDPCLPLARSTPTLVLIVQRVKKPMHPRYDVVL